MKNCISRPSQDACDTCEKYKSHCKPACDDHVETACDTCIKGKKHIEAAQKARHEYKNDSENTENATNKAVFAADTQKIVLSPKLTTKEHFFVSRLVVFNEIFARLSGGSDFLALWREGIAGRLAANVASAWIKCIDACGAESIVF